jgi:putative endonuclease
MPHFVYMVRCANQALYTGYAVDVDARVAKHNAGKGAKYTRMNGPVVLLASWPVPDRMAALKLERRIKSLPRAQKLALADGRRELPGIDGLTGARIWRRARRKGAGRHRSPQSRPPAAARPRGRSRAGRRTMAPEA